MYAYAFFLTSFTPASPSAKELAGDKHPSFYVASPQRQRKKSFMTSTPDLPAYPTKERMMEKLTQAVEETCGFAVE